LKWKSFSLDLVVTSTDLLIGFKDLALPCYWFDLIDGVYRDKLVELPESVSLKL
jgi:hypothetical protein